MYQFLTFIVLIVPICSLSPIPYKNIYQVLQPQLKLHKFSPKTIWFYNENKNTNSTSIISEQDNTLLTGLFASPSSSEWNLPPLIIGNFGKQIRKVDLNTHLTSFIFLVLIQESNNSDLSLICDFITRNGNRRRDRFIFIGDSGDSEPTLRKLFRQGSISELKDKLGVIISTRSSSFELLMDPLIYDPHGEMIKLTITEPDTVSVLSSIFKERPLMGQNLPGRHLKLSGCLLPTWLYRTSNEDGPNGVEYDGSNYRVFLHASHKFNFTFELHAPVDQGYGQLLDNGTWIGMASDLYYTERGFDIAILLGHVLGWYHFIDFSSNLDFANLMFVTTQPRLDIGAESFMLPFQNEVLYSIVGIYGIISFSVLALLVVKKWIKGTHGVIMTRGWTLKNAAYQAISIPYSVALEQALSKVPKNVRFVVGLWMIATIITGTGYRSNLASFLSVPSITPVPATFDDLAAATEYRITLNNLGVAETQFFEFNTNPAIQEIKKRLGYNPNPIECICDSFLLQKMACIAWTPLVSAFAYGALSLNTRLEPLVISSQPALPVSMSVGFLKDSVVVDAMIPITASLFETGLYRRWTEEGYYYFRLQGKAKLEKSNQDSELYKKLKEFEQTTEQTTIRPFNIGNLKLPFYGIGFGIGVGAICFLLEVCLANSHRLGSKRIKANHKMFVLSQLGTLDY